MPTVKFTHALNRFFPGLKETPANADTLKEVLKEIDSNYPGIRNYILDEQGSLRRHVNIFIDGKLISDRKALSDSFTAKSEIFIIQALSGG